MKMPFYFFREDDIEEVIMTSQSIEKFRGSLLALIYITLHSYGEFARLHIIQKTGPNKY